MSKWHQMSTNCENLTQKFVWKNKAQIFWQKYGGWSCTARTKKDPKKFVSATCKHVNLGTSPNLRALYLFPDIQKKRINTAHWFFYFSLLVVGRHFLLKSFLISFSAWALVWIGVRKLPQK